MADIFLEAEVLDLETGDICRFIPDDMYFAYRKTALKGNASFFVLSTRINLAPLGGEYESYTPENLRSIRKIKQPAGFSCGSFFTNPTGYSAGRLIDEAGLKGTRIGGIKVSEQHGNFFINDQKATWKDILDLRDHIKQVIYEQTGITLHEEVRIISHHSAYVHV
jgi:UDP-N-acetylmuramate dehydrogenase